MTKKYDRDDFKRKRVVLPDKRKIRNLKQYKDMTDDEFNALWEERATGVQASAEFEKRIQRKIEEFGKDYDLDDLKANDKLTLRALAQSYLTLEDLENFAYKNREGTIDLDTILLQERLSNIMSSLRRDISSMQNDLKITRKIRKGDKEESVINFIDDLKQKAKKFYQSRMSYIFCDQCNMLLATTWFLYPNEKGNRMQLICGRKLQDGTNCGNKVQITSLELMEKRNVNIDGVPEFFK